MITEADSRHGHVGSVPVVDYLELDGGPHLVAQVCRHCEAMYVDKRVACGRCGHADFGTSVLATAGSLRTFTITHRAAPGVRTPFITGVVELDGGGVVKANVIDVPPDPAALHRGMRMEIATYVAGADRSGTEAIAFAFCPAKEEENNSNG